MGDWKVLQVWLIAVCRIGRYRGIGSGNLTRSRSGEGRWQHKYEIPEKFSAETDIEIRVQLDTSPITDAAVSAGFDLILVDN